MNIKTLFINISTDGQGDFIDITDKIQKKLLETGFSEGSVTVFITGSTAGITTFEYEPGLIKDLQNTFEDLAPLNHDYAHHQTWGCDNGSSHIRAALQGPSLCIPFKDKKLFLGTWQQIVLEEFDTRPRERKIITQFIGI